MYHCAASNFTTLTYLPLRNSPNVVQNFGSEANTMTLTGFFQLNIFPTLEDDRLSS